MSNDRRRCAGCAGDEAEGDDQESNLNIRKGPGTDQPIIGEAADLSEVMLLSQYVVRQVGVVLAAWHWPCPRRIFGDAELIGRGARGSIRTGFPPYREGAGLRGLATGRADD